MSDLSYAQWYDSEISSDLKIITADKTINCHKFILDGECMNKLDEFESGKIYINFVETAAVEIVLKYLYQYRIGRKNDPDDKYAIIDIFGRSPRDSNTWHEMVKFMVSVGVSSRTTDDIFAECRRGYYALLLMVYMIPHKSLLARMAKILQRKSAEIRKILLTETSPQIFTMICENTPMTADMVIVMMDYSKIYEFDIRYDLINVRPKSEHRQLNV